LEDFEASLPRRSRRFEEFRKQRAHPDRIFHPTTIAMELETLICSVSIRCVDDGAAGHVANDITDFDAADPRLLGAIGRGPAASCAIDPRDGHHFGLSDDDMEAIEAKAERKGSQAPWPAAKLNPHGSR
jgi:hypothetical protein